MNGNSFMVAFYLIGKDIHGTETEREKEKQTCESHEVSELLEAVQIFKEFQVAKSDWSVIFGVYSRRGS